MNIKEINPLAEVVKQLEKELEEEIDLRKGAESVIKRHIKTIERSKAYYSNLEAENKEFREQRDELVEGIKGNNKTLNLYNSGLRWDNAKMQIAENEALLSRIKDGEP